MALRRETPRQKMIGMMYLVLTALLALNVSKDVLDAFVIVNEGITKTNLNCEVKNAYLLSQFEAQQAIAPLKVEPWYLKAKEVSQKSDEIYQHIEALKREIVTISEPDGEEAVALRDPRVIYYDSLEVTDNMDYPAQVMIRQGKGGVLREKINDYSKFLLTFVADKDEDLRKSIIKSLSTPDVKEKGEHLSWESKNFENLPLIAVLTNLTLYQSYVRNSEMEILTYLFSQIDAGSFKFDRLEATVIPNSNFILKGNEYTAEVFIAASDSTQDPTVMVGRYETIPLEDGTFDYKMVGNYEQLPVKEGKAIFSRIGSNIGTNIWEGLVQIKNVDGSTTKRPFRAEYQVGEASAVISPTKMNVFYLGVDNPVDISISGVPREQMSATINNGTIVPEGNGYIVRPATQGTAIVTVFANSNGQRRKMGEMNFRVKLVPTPSAKLAGKMGGLIDKSTLAAQIAIQADMEGFDFDLKFQIQGFTLTVSQGEFVKEARSTSARLTDEQKTIIRSLNKGQKVYIDNILAVGPGNRQVELNPIIFKIN